MRRPILGACGCSLWTLYFSVSCFFFFQAEDGIRDFHVTGVQTCALPIFAAKKLRYTMEIFDPIWPAGLKKEIRLARALQDAGGHYHDWCVLRDRIQKEIGRDRKSVV